MPSGYIWLAFTPPFPAVAGRAGVPAPATLLLELTAKMQQICHNLPLSWGMHIKSKTKGCRVSKRLVIAIFSIDRVCCSQNGFRSCHRTTTVYC